MTYLRRMGILQEHLQAGCVLGFWDNEYRLIGPVGVIAKGNTMAELMEAM